jgi:superfamily II DNA or RNA helicase
VPIEATVAHGVRFSHTFLHEEQWWGSLAWEDRIPAGLTARAQAIAQHYGVACTVRDTRIRPSQGYPWHSVTGVAWRPYQERAHEAAVLHGSGVVVAPPRAGKTLLQARLLDVLALPAIVLAPTVAIVAQTYGRFAEIWGADLVSRLDGDAQPSERDPLRPIVVSTIPSALALPLEWWATRQVLILDEVHHAAANTWHEINQRAEHIYHRYGYTGTHYRSGEDALAMHAVLGEVIADIPLAELIAGGYLAVPRVLWVKHSKGRAKLPTGNFAALYKAGIAEYEPRNAAVINIAGALRDHGEHTIVLTRRRAHADMLGKAIEGSIVVKGGEGPQTAGAIRDFLAGRYSVLIGTTVIGEGVDLPRASALVYAAGGNGGVQMMQSYFRPLTGHAGKSIGRIYDLWDSHSELLRKQSADRMQFARDQLGTRYVHAT